MLSQHLIKSRDRPHPNKFKTIRADCSSHYSGLGDSLPCSPHLSALYKDQPYGQAQSPPTPSHTLPQTLAPRPPSDNLGMVRILLFPTTMAGDGLPHNLVTFILKLSTHVTNTASKAKHQLSLIHK